MKIKILAWLLTAALGAVPITVNAQQYTAIDLGAVQVYGINARGQVAGSLSNGTGLHAFVTNATTNAIIILNDLNGPGNGYAEAYGINASGKATGLSYLPSGSYHAFINDTATNTPIDLGSLDGGNSWGDAINASGQVTGFDGVHAFITNAATNAIIDLGTLGSAASVGTGINDSGQVTGYDGPYGEPTHAFITNATTHAMTDLGTLGGRVSAAYGINASGQVTGYANLSGDAAAHAFITDASTHAMTDLGTLGGTFSEGLGINASGQVTGVSTTATDLSGHGFLYTNGHMLDLNSLLSPTQAALYTIISGQAINDRGQIAAVGYPNAAPSQSHSFLLTPSTTVFQCRGFLPPFNVPLALQQTDSMILLKAQLLDSNDLRVDPAVLAALDAAPPVAVVSYRAAASPLAAASSLLHETSLAGGTGISGSGYQMHYDPASGDWSFNLSSAPYTASGIYTVSLQSGDATKYQVSPQCSGSFSNSRSRAW